VVSDGKAFGADGFLRFSYATTLENLQKALEKLKDCLNQNN
jgi:bifunctional pyridoxal-dependent enzyme with beta-cystathionase and maltose regulon repressor activities